MRIGIFSFIVVGFLCIAGCVCDLTVFTPKQLITDNEVVMLGQFVSLDTLATAGDILSDLGPETIYIVEYTFEPIEIFKGEKRSDQIHLWYCLIVDEDSDYDNGIDIETSEIALVYGNQLLDTNNILDLFTPTMAGSLDSLKNMLSGAKLSGVRGFNQRDSLVGEKIIRLDTLKSLLLERIANSQVIYGTDPYLFTLDSYLRGIISYCDYNGFFSTTMSSDEYIKKLR